MVRVELRSFGPGTCSWCGNDKKDVFTVVFDDGSFDGPVDLCFNDFRRATQLKLARAGKRAADRPAPPADGKA